MSKLIKKLIIIFSIIIFILFLALIVASWSLGAFAPVLININERGPHYFLTTKSRIHYKDITRQLEYISTLYGEPPDHIGLSGALLHSNPSQTPHNKLIVQAGYLLNDSLGVDSILVIKKIKRRKVLTASIDANPAIAIFKIYPALLNWIEKNGKNYNYEYPALEYYSEPKFVIELPIESIHK